MVYRKTLNLYRTFKFVGNFKVTQYYKTVVGPHFQRLEFHIKIHGMARKNVFSAQKAGERSLFWNWLEFQLYLGGHPEFNNRISQIWWQLMILICPLWLNIQKIIDDFGKRVGWDTPYPLFRYTPASGRSSIFVCNFIFEMKMISIYVLVLNVFYRKVVCKCSVPQKFIMDLWGR